MAEDMPTRNRTMNLPPFRGIIILNLYQMVLYREIARHLLELPEDYLAIGKKPLTLPEGMSHNRQAIRPKAVIAVKFRDCLLVFLVIVSIVSTTIFAGCSNRDKRAESNTLTPALQEADAALNRAQVAMQGAGIDVQLSDIGALARLETILPSPMKLGALEDQQVIQDAIRAMYQVLDAIGQSQVARAPQNPAQVDSDISDSDLLLTHIHLAYLYVLEAVRISTIAGWGEDGKPDTNDDFSRIAFPAEVTFEDAKALEEIYSFELTERIQAIFDAIEADKNHRKEDYLQLFSQSQRQAIVDALRLLLGAEVKVPTFANLIGSDGQPIIEQIHTVDHNICRQDALFHLQAALNIARKIAPDFEQAIDEFNEIIVEVFAEDFFDQILQWGFEGLNNQEVRKRLDELITSVTER